MPSSLFDRMMAYTGRDHIESDDVFVVDVDVSWHPSWLGTKQRRYFKIEGDMLWIVSAPGVTVREQTEQAVGVEVAPPPQLD